MKVDKKNILQCKQCGKKITFQSKSKLCQKCVHRKENLSPETLMKQSAATSGKNNGMYGRTGEKSPLYGKTGEKNSMFGKKHTPESIEKNRVANSGKNNGMYGKHHNLESIAKMRFSKIGKKATPETKAKMSLLRKGKNHPLHGKHHSDEAKRKMRISAIRQISKNKFNGHQVIPGWNPVACQKIDEYGKQYGYNFQHAMNGGEHCIEELGYWVDGYDKEKNTVIEYYEKHHNNRVQKDLDRETEICNHFGCDFIILWE